MELIIILFAAGILLLFVEIYLTPGMTLFGIFGILCIVWANVEAFQVLSSPWNYIVSIFSVGLTLLFLYAFFRILQSKNFSVQSQITSKVNVINGADFKKGELGKTITALRPNGRAIFNDKVTEVYSNGEYVDSDIAVEILKITSDKLFVKPIKPTIYE